MIYLYSGTPGSGKSLDVAADIMRKLRRGQNVICNFPINLDLVRNKTSKRLFPKVFKNAEYKIGNFIYKDNSELNPQFLVDYAKENHKKGKEGQTLIVIDECATLFNPREYQLKDRPLWIKFFQLHRHLGYNVILIAQNDRLIDRQIRSFIEYDCKHRKANNYGNIGFIFTILHIKLFCAVDYWYGVRERCGIRFFTYRSLYSKLYDSYSAFDRDLNFTLATVKKTPLGELGRDPAPPGGATTIQEGV